MKREWVDKADKIDSEFGRHEYVCPNCGESSTSFVGGVGDWWCIRKPRFCHNCGERIVEEEK